MGWTWDLIAKYIDEELGCFVDWNERFFICPDCGEPIYKCDYPYIDIGMICPVCEFMDESGEDE